MGHFSHHAYFYEGSLSLFPALAEHARNFLKFTETHSPDVVVREFEKFGVDEARELTHRAELKSASGRALYVIGVSSITSEAQQALLKSFEEPKLGVMFVILAPHGLLLPTLRSRMLPYPEVVSLRREKVGAKEFLQSTYKTRSTHIASLLKEENNEKERTRDFINALEKELYMHVQKTKIENIKEIAAGLEDIARVRDYVADRSPSLKMLLEHLAVALPTL